MPDSVARLVFRAVAVVLGKVRAGDLLQMVVFGEIGSDQQDGCEGKPSNRMSRIITNSIAGLDAARLCEMTRPLCGAAKAFCFLILQLSVRREPRR